MVATMSRMWPLRSRDSAATNAPSPTTTGALERSAASASSSSSSTPTTAARRVLMVRRRTDALRVGGGRPVERGGGRRAPVDDDRLLAGRSRSPSRPMWCTVPSSRSRPAEHQALAGGVEVDPAGRGGQRGDVALVHGLRGAGGRAEALALAPLGLPPQLLQAGGGPVEHDLLAGELVGEGCRCRVVAGHRNSLPARRQVRAGTGTPSRSTAATCAAGRGRASR
jgi:hypothetical protein